MNSLVPDCVLHNLKPTLEVAREIAAHWYIKIEVFTWSRPARLCLPEGCVDAPAYAAS